MRTEALVREIPSWSVDQATHDWVDEVMTAADRVPEQRGQALRGILEDLTVPHPDIDAVMRLDARLERYPQLSELRRRSAAALLQGLGEQPVAARSVPTFTGADDPALRYFWVLVFADLQPHVSSWHADHGISAEVSRRTLADLGRQMTHNRRRLGYGGLTLNVDWLCTHFHGRLYQLGRLQFEMNSLGGTTAAEIAASGRPAAIGDAALSVHIPDYSGPFTPSDCRAAIDLADPFFARHFPEFKGDVMTCHSWLLDRRLPVYLSPESNIVQFQRLFTITHRERDADDATFFEAVFGSSDLADLAALPQTSTLQRALVSNLRDGHHWYGGVGWRPLRQQ